MTEISAAVSLTCCGRFQIYGEVEAKVMHQPSLIRPPTDFDRVAKKGTLPRGRSTFAG